MVGGPKNHRKTIEQDGCLHPFYSTVMVALKTIEKLLWCFLLYGGMGGMGGYPLSGKKSPFKYMGKILADEASDHRRPLVLNF